MTIHERAAAARARAHVLGGASVGARSAHERRLRAAMTRDMAALPGVAPEHVVVGDDPARSYGAAAGQLITWPTRTTRGWCCGSCPSPATPAPAAAPTCCWAPARGAAARTRSARVPVLSVAALADLARTPITAPYGAAEPDPEQVPVEFFDDPVHAPDCPLR